ncbi:MAG TPA: DUF4139 domain-containing protein [Spirochaetota bacterium]|nr:DUF4139 domain-containing protein [Spirochaetota bacterium]HPJ33456.1 DUF4139 domain-containing protein [Spirochaetota bacterium]
MVRRIISATVIIISFSALSVNATTAPISAKSRITAVKLFTNRAEITRTSRIRLKKGMNSVLIEELPDNLYDWSVRGSLPENFKGKIISMEISRQALLEKRRKKIAKIEEKLEELRDIDANLADDLDNIKGQNNFINSINEFTRETASKELQTRIPQTELWSNTLNYTAKKKKELQNRSREIQKKRRELAREIQKWEFELVQIGGSSYFSSYQKINRAMEKNIAKTEVQQYADVTDQYAQQQSYLRTDTSGIDTEKRLLLNIYSATEDDTNFHLIYMIPKTYWHMMYDFRASKTNNEIEVILYANIYQKTGEDWEGITLSLSTGKPLTNIALPHLAPWYLNSRGPRRDQIGGYSKLYKKANGKSGFAMAEEDELEDKKKEGGMPQSTVKKAGLNFEVSFPVKQTIQSSEKYQKKLIKSYTLKSSKGLKYYFETVPESTGKVFLMAKTTNQTELPWLGGEAQVFLENDFIGKVNIPDTPVAKEQDLVLGIAPDMTAKKELVKKFNDTSGVFGGNNRVIYSYKITVENNSSEKREIIVLDNFPVSNNKEIEVEIKNLSMKFVEDEKIKKTTEYKQGIRKYTMSLPAGAKKEITYDAVITYDKELIIDGLK